MSDQAKAKVQIRRGRDYKKDRTRLINVGTALEKDFWRLRRVDLMSMFIEGLIPASLMSAVANLQEARTKMISFGIIEGMKDIPPEQIRDINRILRACAVIAVLEPKLTHSKAASLSDPDLLWVGGVSDVPEDNNREESGDVEIGIMMTIWKSVLGENGVETFTEDAAIEFRQSQQAKNVAAVSDGETVRAEAVVMVTDAGSDAAKDAGGSIDASE